MSTRMYGGNDFEVVDYAILCMTGACIPEGLLYGWSMEGDIDGTFDATGEIIIGSLDAPDDIPAGAWRFISCGLMYGAFAQIVRRP